MSQEDIRQILRREVTPELYREIRELWKKHSIAEDRRDIPGLLSTLTEDCVYEDVESGRVWRGHVGATEFYTSLLGAYPDIKFHLTDIVIGPQGVCEEADADGTHQGEWLGQTPTGKKIAFRMVVFFPWDPAQRKFKGERIYVRRTS